MVANRFPAYVDLVRRQLVAPALGWSGTTRAAHRSPALRAGALLLAPILAAASAEGAEVEVRQKGESVDPTSELRGPIRIGWRKHE